MRLIKLNNTIFNHGLIFVCFGVIFSSNAFSAPLFCDDAENIGSQEDQLLTKQFSYDPSGGDFVDCYKFTVSSGVGLSQLSVTLLYDVIDENSDELILKLFDSRSSSVLKTTTIGGGDFTGQQGLETLFWESADGLVAGETYYIRIDNDTTIPDSYGYEVKWNDDDDTTPAPSVTLNSENPADEAEVKAGDSEQLLQVSVTDSDSCTVYYGIDENAISTSMIDNDTDSCLVTVPYGSDMTNSGKNYWYVEATNTTGTTRYPTTGTLSFTVKSQFKGMPWLMLLLKSEDGGSTTPPTGGKAMPWLMLLL